jgi:hypothetical protein
MTTSAEAQEIEARLERLAAPRQAGGEPGAAGVNDASAAPVDVAAELRAIDGALAVLSVPHEEWEVLYRERLQVERDLLAGARAGAAFPGGATTLAPTPDRATAEGDGLPGWLPGAIAIGGLVLTAADVILAIIDRRRGA